MRRQRLLRNGSSTQSLCIFCASRFLQSGLPATSSVSRRRLNTTRAPHQSAAAAAVQPINGSENNPGQPITTQHESTLTAAELQEKQRRRQQYEAAEQERLHRHREQLERQHAARQAAEQAAEQDRLRDIEARETAAKEYEAARVAEEERVRQEEASKGSGLEVVSSFLPRSPQSSNRDGIGTKRLDFKRQQDSDAMQGRGYPNTRQDRQMQQRGGFRIRYSEPVRGVRLDDPSTQQKSSQSRKPERTGMPNFGLNSKDKQFEGSPDGGWGSGSAEVQPLEYGEQEQRVSDEAAIQSTESEHRYVPPQAASETSDTIADMFAGLSFDTGDRSRQSGFGGYNRKGPSVNKDDFWSSASANDPPPQAPQGRREKSSGAGDFGYTGYRTTPFNPTDEYYSSTYNPRAANDESNTPWSHLRRKGGTDDFAAPEEPPLTSFIQQPRQQRPSYRQSQHDIDRGFRDHQAQRPQNTPTNFTFNRSPQNDNNAAFNARRTCARCFKIGHIARDCMAPASEVKAEAGGRKDGTMFRRTNADSQYTPPFGGSMETKQPLKQEGSQQWRPFGEVAQVREPTEEDAESLDRQARRSKRGFEDGKDTVEATGELRERRKSRRSMEQEDGDSVDEANALREERAARKSARKAAKRQVADNAEHQATSLMLPEFISVSQLAQVLNVRYERLLERLESEGYDDIFPGKILNMETSGMIAMEYDFEPQFEYDSAVAREEQERDLKARPELEDKLLLPTRPPVVTIMGHVDHGKTTILDFLRKSSVAAGEAGGITQHIGAFSVPMSSSGRTITFLDTPGHAAFLAMRQRGANVTDIVVLVVAADDSVKPQTLESLRCAREAGVPILVAINKVDKEGADIQRVKHDLAKHGIEIEDFGGDVQTVSVSGKTGAGMAEFEEAIATLSEILDHRAEIDGNVEGWVLEATTKSHGRVATVLVKRGTLRVGKIIVAGKTWARVRSLRNEKDQALTEVGPGMPVEVDGWKEQAVAGDQVLQAPSEQKAGSVVEYRIEVADREKANEDMEAINESRRLEQEKRAREKAAEEAAKRGTAAVEDNPTAVVQEQPKETVTSGQMTIPFIIKADVSGSAEAVSAYIPSLTSPLIAPQILSSGVGAVNESDIEYAAAAQGHIIAFNLPQNNEALGMAESKGVKILENDVIYRTLDQVKEVLEAKLPPIVTQRVLGEAEVAAGFEIGVGGRKTMKIAGCKIRNGVVGIKSRARVMRGGEKVYDGVITSLKNVKKDVQEMRKGTECGMGFDKWEEFEVGDVVQTYEEISEKRKL